MDIQNIQPIKIFEGYADNLGDLNALQSYLAVMPKLSRNLYVRQFQIFHKTELFEIIKKKVSGITRIRKISNNSDFFCFEFKIGNTKNVDRGYFAIIPGSSKEFSRITSISYSDYWNIVVRRIVKRLYPEAMPVFFRQDEIENAFLNLERSLGMNFRIRIADVTAKEERNQNNVKQRTFDTQRRWTDLPIKDVFTQAKERGQWFTGLRFVIQQRYGNSDRFISKASGRIHKYGEIYFDHFYSEISKNFLDILEALASKRFSILDGRGLREQNYQAVKPIEIAFEYEIFNDIEEIRRFGRVVSNYPNATKSVYHSNPYYHASIADFLDGSSFDLWVLSPQKIVILPQAKSSSQAFERIISHISSNFYEGVVDEYRE